MTTKSHPEDGSEKPEKKPAAKKAAPKAEPKTQPAAKDAADEKPAETPESAAATEAAPEAEKPAKKEPKERHFVDAKTGKTIDKPKQGGSGAETNKAIRDEMHAERKGNALPFRIGAIVLWVLGIVFEVLAILSANGTLFLPGPNGMTWCIIFLVVDLVFVVVGSQLWKHANHISPASKENKMAYWVQTELGVIIAVIAFAPVIVLMLTNKDMDPKAKKVCSIVAGVALIAAIGSGIDYHPTTQEDLDTAEAGAAVLSDDGLAYWTPFGTKYHFNPDCQYLKNSGTIYSGTVQEAIDAGRDEGCSGCTVEGGSDVLTNADPQAVAEAAANAVSVSGDTPESGVDNTGVENTTDTGDNAETAGEEDSQEELPRAA